MDDRLAVSVTSADGRRFRWGADESDAGDVPAGLSFTTSDPGGFKDATLSLGRRIDVDFPDLDLFDSVRIYGPGAGESAWEGRIEDTPRSHGTEYAVTVAAVGHAAHLRDDPTFREIYVDRETSRWAAMSQTMRALLGIAYRVTDPQVRFDYTSRLPCVELAFSRIAAIAGTVAEEAEAWYDGGGIAVGSCYYDVVTSHALGTGWSAFLQAHGDDSGASPYGTAVNFTGGTSFTGTAGSATGATCYRLVLRYSNTYTGDGAWYLQLRRAAVFGAHGLTKRGSAPDQGLYASDVIADVVRRTAPQLTYTTGTGGSIEESAFVIPHLVFLEPVTAEDAILAVNAFHQRSWGVEDDRRFFWRSAQTPRRRWRTRLSDGTQVNLAGPQAENAINGVIVRFEAPSGVQETAGPPGSGCKTTSSLLVDDDPANPATAHGLKRWAIVDLSFVTTGGASGGAVQVGAAYLQETLANLNVRGDVTHTGPIRNDAGIVFPPWAVRAGDSILIEDGDATERRIIETSYDHDARSVTCSLDAASHRTDALMERMGVALVGVL